MIDKSKTYRTRGGKKVKIFMTDGGGPHPVLAAYFDEGQWFAFHTTIQGRRYHYESPFDLIEVRPRIKREVWVNVYPDCPGNDLIYSSKAYADRCAEADRIACVKLTIDCEEGEGL